MGKKRKRPAKTRKDRGPTVSSQTSITASPGRFKSLKAPVARNNQTTHTVISLYYREVLTLRQYLLRQLPVSSKLRRRRIASLGSSAAEPGDVQPLANLLDSTLVGVLKESTPKVDSDRRRGYRAFTQSQSRSILVSTDTGPTSPQSEVSLKIEDTQEPASSKAKLLCRWSTLLLNIFSDSVAPPQDPSTCSLMASGAPG